MKMLLRPIGVQKFDLRAGLLSQRRVDQNGAPLPQTLFLTVQN
jgi:hypothetical protein